MPPLARTDNLIYEDPIVKMKVEGKDQIRAGMVGFLGKSRRPVDVIKNQIAVANVVVLEHELSFESNEHDDVWQPITRRQVTIFEFEGRKIKRMADYWAR